jgi:hypothetical protein
LILYAHILLTSLQIWQAFAGVSARRITGYYNNLLDDRTAILDEKDPVDPVVNEQRSAPRKATQPEKWKGQIEKVVFCNSLNLEKACHGWQALVFLYT